MHINSGRMRPNTKPDRRTIDRPNIELKQRIRTILEKLIDVCSHLIDCIVC